jgi:hypothetical protein
MAKIECDMANIEHSFLLEICQFFGLTLLQQLKLNWEPELNIDQMCRDTWNWQKNNPNGYTKTI